MNNGQILKLSFFIWFLVTIIGAILKIMHHLYGDFLLSISIFNYSVFTCLVIYEVFKADKINKSEKTMWIIGMLFFGVITGILYLLVGRKQVVNNQRL